MSDPSAAPTTCYRHPDRRAGVRCQRCEKLICPSCMNSASVGFHCPDCFKAGAQRVHTGAGMFHARPVVTQALIAINVLVFVASIASGDGIQGDRAADGLLANGGLAGFFVDVLGEWYRIITSGFLHYGIFHIGMNMYALWILGPQFENTIGRGRFALTYLAALMGGSFGAMLLTPNGLTAGASGAIFGLLGLAVASHRSLGRSIWDSGLGTILLLNFVITFGIPSISVGGHVGGFVAGFLAGTLIYEAPRRVKLPKGGVEAGIVLLGIIGFVGAYLAAGRWDNVLTG